MALPNAWPGQLVDVLPELPQLLITPAGSLSTAWAFVPGLVLIGLGLGAMLTPSVNVVQSSFPEERQGEISGLSRSVSNLGSSFGTAIAGTILVAGLTKGAYAVAMITLAVAALGGLVAAALLPRGTGLGIQRDPQTTTPNARG